MKKIIFSLIALAAISLTSCSNDDQTADAQAQAQEQKLTSKTAKILALCTSNSASVTVNRWQAPSSVDANWTPVAAAIGGVNVQWEGIYGGSIRPAGNTAQWYVGTINLNQTCADYDIWSANIVVKNAAANVGTAPASDPYNVLGYDGSISGSNYGLGYYSYNITTHVMTPAKAIVIWKSTGTGLNSHSVTNPATATEAYLVKVTSIAPGTSSSTVNYTWTQVK